MKKVRLLTLFLVLLMLFMTACSNKNDNSGTETTTAPTVSADTTAAQGGEQTTPDGTTTEVVTDNIPELNYNGATVNYLLRKSRAYENDIADLTGETTNDAIYNRNLAVAERLGVKFNFIQMNGVWGATEQTNAIKNSVKAGTKEFDIISGAQSMMIDLAMEGDFTNIYDLDYIDTTAKWWSQKMNDTLTIHDKLFVTTGDCNITMWEAFYCMFFNKQLQRDLGLPDIYELVDSGKWTLAKLTELSSNIYSDMNGDGLRDAEDRYGFVTSISGHPRVWLVTMDTPLGKINNDGDIELCFYSDRTEKVYADLLHLYQSPDTYTGCTEVASLDSLKDPAIFTTNRGMFMTGYLKVASIMRQTECDFGIIPYPKYDENQAEYQTTPHNNSSVICFSVDMKDPEMSSAVAEALCVQGYKEVTPAFYEIVLKSKNATDEQSSRMVDLIRDSMTFDVGWVHSAPLNTIGTIYEDMLKGNITSIAATWKGKSKAVEKKLKEINETYAKMDR